MSLAAQVLDAARAKGWMIATAESCTGGMVAAALTDIAGSSDVFDRGFVSYSYDSKEDMLGVSHDTLQEKGAVSAEVAAQMAQGALNASKANIAVAITGVAGPGASDDKPEGLVWFGLATKAKTSTQLVEFGPQGRAKVRSASVRHVLEMLLGVLNPPKS